MPRTVNSKQHIDALVDTFGTELDANMVKAYCNTADVSYQTITKYLNEYKVSRGHWNLTVEEVKQELEQSVNKTEALVQNLIPEKDDTFVQFGNFNNLKKVIASRSFYPVFITGMSGTVKRSVLSKRVHNSTEN